MDWFATEFKALMRLTNICCNLSMSKWIRSVWILLANVVNIKKFAIDNSVAQSKNCGSWLVITITQNIYFATYSWQYILWGPKKISSHQTYSNLIYRKRYWKPYFFYQGEFFGETLIQASLLMHQTLLRLGVAATELVLASLDENSKSEVLLELEWQCTDNLFISSVSESFTCRPTAEVSQRFILGK